ncbi:MAG: 50S ribosomal protein L33 [Alphaproteobacteria bacterium]|nr:50S ribosomal protein L33 [Alphaproteobacteria bacterium]MDD9920406.1 50S ribosomal protein L33 [Alphaproteobacteria bacterium]
MASGPNSIYIKLVSKGVYPEGHAKAGQKTGYYYVTKKNPKSERTQEKMVFRKYDPMIRQHVEFVEAKIK